MLSLTECNICPRLCGNDRFTDTGYCKAGSRIKINLYQRHFGEEPNLGSDRGSGTVFFSHCNTNCIYCQNFSISQFGWGKEVEIEELAEIMISLRDSGVCNINLVTPTHFTPLVKEAIILAKQRGLSIPIVWNSNAYERVEALQELEGVVDIYLPDFRYFDRLAAKKYSEAEDYPEVAQKALLEMFRQVGHIEEKDNIAVKGLMIRLLLLPNNVNRIDLALEWIAKNLGRETYISLMGQYYPTYRAVAFPELNRAISAQEYDDAVNKLNSLGFENGYIQERGGDKDWTPKFSE